MFRLILLVGILYFCLFNPIFLAIGIGSFKIILVISLLYAIANPNSILFLKKFKIEALFIFILMIYSLINSLRTFVGLFELQYLNLIWFFESIIFPVILIFLFKKEFGKYGLEKILVITGTLAGVISIILLLNPGWNNFVRNSLISYSGSDIERYELIRGYGIAENLFGSYAMIQGIILGICFFYISKNIVFAIPVLPLMISIAFNARTGLFAIPISILLLVFTGKFNLRWIIILGFFSFLIVYLFNSNNSFIENNLLTINWIFSGLDVVAGNFNGDFSNGAAETLLQDERFRPNNIFEFLFGTAQFGPDSTRADNGFFFTLWYGGVLNMLLILFFLGFMFYRLWRVDKKKYFVLLMFLLLLLYNVKWNFLFVPSGISRLIGIYYVWNIWLFYNRKTDQRMKNNLAVGRNEKYV